MEKTKKVTLYVPVEASFRFSFGEWIIERFSTLSRNLLEEELCDQMLLDAIHEKIAEGG